MKSHGERLRPGTAQVGSGAIETAAARPEFLDSWAHLVEDALQRVAGACTAAGVMEGVRHQLGSGGKRLRPALVLWHLAAFRSDTARGLPFAVALELMHNYLLIHDDIEDGDEVRRDRPTLWVRFGLPLALNVADYLLAEAYRAVDDVDPPATARSLARAFTAVLRATVEGQALDILGRGDAHLTRARYIEMTRLKTGRYFALAGVGAGILAGRPASDLAILERAGDAMGLAFQIRDDLLDLTPGKGRGREIGCDVREGKPSCLAADALESGDLAPSERERLVSILARARSESSPSDVEWVMTLYRRSGCVARCQAQAEDWAARAAEAYSALGGLTSEAHAELRRFLDFLVKREG